MLDTQDSRAFNEEEQVESGLSLGILNKFENLGRPNSSSLEKSKQKPHNKEKVRSRGHIR